MSALPILIYLPILIIFALIIYRLFTSKRSNKISNRKMTILSIIVGLFPIMPLAIVATVAGVATLTEMKFFLALFFLGGPFGLFSLLRSLLGHQSKANFWMLIYGGISYSILLFTALYGIFASGAVAELVMGKLNLHDAIFSILIFIYASLSATIFPWHLWITNKALKNQEVSQ